MEIREKISHRDAASVQIWQFARIKMAPEVVSFPTISFFKMAGQIFARIRGPTSFYILLRREILA